MENVSKGRPVAVAQLHKQCSHHQVQTPHVGGAAQTGLTPHEVTSQSFVYMRLS